MQTGVAPQSQAVLPPREQPASERMRDDQDDAAEDERQRDDPVSPRISLAGSNPNSAPKPVNAPFLNTKPTCCGKMGFRIAIARNEAPMA